MEFEWSDEFRFTNKKTGFFSKYIGSNRSSIYLLQQNISKSKPFDKAKLMLVAMNKNSLGIDTTVRIKGFPENAGQERILDSLDYLHSVVSEGRILVFWRKLKITDSTRTEEVYAQSFRPDLKLAKPLKKVFTFDQEFNSEASIFDPSKCIVVAKEGSDQVVLGTEYFNGASLEFKYLTLNEELSISALHSIPLPQIKKEFSNQLTSTYQVLDNGILLIKSSVAYTLDEIWDHSISHSKSYPALTVVKIATGAYRTLKLRGENKTISDFSCQNIGGVTRVLGFFGDLSKDTTGIDKQGVFYVDISNSTLENDELKYVYFTKTEMNRLFPKKRQRKRAKEKVSEQEVLETRFDIEHLEAMSDSSIVCFFNSEYNSKEITSRSNLRGENVYNTTSTFKKRDVFAIRFSFDGKVLWSRSIERKVSYQQNDVRDIRVVYKHDEFFLIYGDENAELKPPKKGKKYQHLTEELSYTTFDPNTGRAKTYIAEVNEPKTAEKEKHFLDPNSAVVIDNQFYFHKIRVRQNPLWTVANVVCFPTLYYSVLTGNTKLGKGEFSTMRVMEGRRPRNRR